MTDKQKSCGAAKRDIMPGIDHHQHKGLNNRTELRPTDPTKGAADAKPKGSCQLTLTSATFFEFAIVTRLLPTIAVLVVRRL